MAGSTNFLQWNPDANNQETDAAWAGDVLRQNGAPAGASICPSVMDNKFRYQVTTFIAALAQALANKGYAVSDVNLATLTATLAAVITLVDLAPYELHSDMAADVEAIGDPRYLQIANFLSTLESNVSTLENNYFDPRYAKLAGNSSQLFSVANAVSAAQAVAYGQSFGLGQTWQDVSRASDTTYYNTTACPIMVMVGCQDTAGSAYCSVTVDEVNILPQLHYDGSNSIGALTATFVVPPGASYSVSTTALNSWYELR